jgi:hypothetical protein
VGRSLPSDWGRRETATDCSGNYPRLCRQFGGWRWPAHRDTETPKRERSNRSRCITLCFGRTEGPTSEVISAVFRQRLTARDMNGGVSRDSAQRVSLKGDGTDPARPAPGWVEVTGTWCDCVGKPDRSWCRVGEKRRGVQR